MTFALAVVEIGESEVACVIREEDGAYLTLGETNVLMDLKATDSEAYATVIALAQKLASKFPESLLA